MSSKQTKLIKKPLTRDELERLLKQAADLVRTRVDYTFILVLLFLKRINDKWELEYEKAYKKAIKDGLSEEEAKKDAKNPTWHDFDLPDDFHWDDIRKETQKLPEKLSRGLKEIAERNPELKDVFGNLDFIEFTANSENVEILRQLIELFSAKKFYHVSPDILGDAYEWILRHFAPQKAKEGEVYTPREVIKLMVEILDPKPGESVYDPASASNGMLIISHDHVKEKYGREEAEKLRLYGQEVNPKTLALGKMNLYIHEIINAHIEQGDTLLHPKFKEGENIKKFDIVIANPPWNQDGYGEETLKKGEFWKQRFKYGFPTKKSADWAWIQHMLASSKDRVGVVIDNGCLFRGGREKAIRTKIIEDDLIESVILLPEKLFYNTGAPGAIIIFNKNKPKKRKEKILFINASEEYNKHPEVRKLNILTEENIKKIVDTYRAFEDSDGFARVAELEEIRDNDYNLNVPLYAFPEEEIEEIDIAAEWKKLKEIEEELSQLQDELEKHLIRLGYLEG